MNEINLHYLDWGGNGDVLLFLAGMGCNAHVFDDLAPRFVDKLHVMALTRRGHGESDHPETGYDINKLTEDLRQFLHAAYDRHSISYKEMVEKSQFRRIQFPGADAEHYSAEEYFAALSPFSLIWTEAMAEQSLHEISKDSDGKIIDRMSDEISNTITNTLTGYELEDSKIKAPALAFFSLSKGLNTISDEWMTAERKEEIRNHVETRENCGP